MRFILDVSKDGVVLTRLADSNAVELPTMEQQIADPKVGLVVCGRSFSDLERALVEACKE
jgi:hypothetical protein